MQTRGIRRAARAALATIATVALALGLLAPAEAAPVDVSYVLVDGSEIVIGATTFPLFDPANPTGSGIVGVVDDVTGEFEGDFISTPRRSTQHIDAPVPGNLDLVIGSETQSSEGTVDPVTGEVAVVNVFDIVITVEQLVPDASPTTPVPLNVQCTIPGIELKLTSAPPGFPATSPGDPFAIADAGFAVPEPECEGTQPGVDPAIVATVRSGIIALLTLPTSDTSIYLEFAPGDPVAGPPPTTATTVAPPTSTTAAPAAVAAQPVRTTPRVTG
jgi:hypothetical protein